MRLHQRFSVLGMSMTAVIVIYWIATHEFKSPGDMRELDTHNLPRDAEEKVCEDKDQCHEIPQQEIAVHQYTRQYDFYYRLTNLVNYDVDIVRDKDVVPRIIHITWMNNTFQFRHLVSFTSALKFIAHAQIYFWHDVLPVGEYWDKLMQRNYGMLLIRQKVKRKSNEYHSTEGVEEIRRLEILLEYGGIVFDLNTVIAQPLDSLLKYDVTVSRCAENKVRIVSSKPWADFLLVLHAMYTSSYYVSSRAVLEDTVARLPGLVHVDIETVCSPTNSRFV